MSFVKYEEVCTRLDWLFEVGEWGPSGVSSSCDFLRLSQEIRDTLNVTYNMLFLVL